MPWLDTAALFVLIVGHVAWLFLILTAAGMFLLLAARLLLPPRPPLMLAALPPPDELPRVLVQIPAYNEEKVVERVLRSAANLRWPRDRFRVQLLDSSTDRTAEIAARVIAELRARGTDAVSVRCEVWEGYKAGALARGHRLGDEPFVVVLDADFEVPEDWLETGMRAMLADPGLAYVQFRMEIRNAHETWVTRMEQLIRDLHYVVEQEGRQRLGDNPIFGGSGGILRRTAIDDAGGWSSASLTEDIDLSLRMLTKGWRGTYLAHPPARAEAPATVAALRVQYTRWSKGPVQLRRELLAAIRRAGWHPARTAMLLLLFVSSAALPCMAVAAGSPVLYFVMTGHAPPYLAAELSVTAVVVLCLVAGVTLTPWVILKRGSLARYAGTVAAVPLFFFLLGVTSAVGIVGAAFGRREAFVRTPKTGS